MQADMAQNWLVGGKIYSDVGHVKQGIAKTNYIFQPPQPELGSFSTANRLVFMRAET